MTSVDKFSDAMQREEIEQILRALLDFDLMDTDGWGEGEGAFASDELKAVISRAKAVFGMPCVRLVNDGVTDNSDLMRACLGASR